MGSWGYVEAAGELKKQMATLNMQVTDVAFACGSGGTAAGLAIGSRLCQLGATSEGETAKVHAFAVCDSVSGR